MKIGLSALLVLFASVALFSQVPDAPATSPSSDANDATSSILREMDKLSVVASQSASDIGNLHIEKWKATSEAKSSAQANADSVRRNLSDALPGLIGAVRSKPGDLNAQFKLYRDLNALHGVLGTLTEVTRVLGQKRDYEALSQQLEAIGSIRRMLADTLEQSTAATQRELDELRGQIKEQEEKLASANAAAAEARKEVAVAQAALQKSATPKKKTATKKAAANTSSNSSAGAQSQAVPPPVPKL